VNTTPSFGPEGDPARAFRRPHPVSRRNLMRGGTLGVFGALFLSACSDDASSRGSSSEPSASSTPPAVTVQPEDGAQQVNPTAPVRVSTDRGEVESVELTGPAGAVQGRISEDGKSWTAEGPLEFDAQYTLNYVAQDGDDRAEGSRTFSTVTPELQANATLNVVDGETYGVGQVIQFAFSEPVLNKAEVEKAITVTGGGAEQGRFRWYSDILMRYRPPEKWAPQSRVELTADLLGVDFGNGMIGNENLRLAFSTGERHFAIVDNADKILRVYVDDEEVQQFPATLGNPDWPSVTGELVIMEQQAKYSFNPSSLGLTKGDPHWYEPFDASWTSRLTRSGVFVHQALPSAIPLLGVANVSHGCIGLPPEGARYIYENFRVGDVIEAKNTDYPQADPDDGYGDWNIPFEHYSDASWHGNW
jgi:lipoprotein-anchoring transpeptidase ErfK/SrfK